MTKMDQIENLCHEIGREFKPDKVILFGSHAYGTPTKGSDVDLLVIMRFKGEGVWKAIEILEKLNPRFGVDLIVKTPRQIEQRLSWNDFFIREIIEKGKVIYEADNP